MVEEKKSLAVDLDGFDLEQDYYVAWHPPAYIPLNFDFPSVLHLASSNVTGI